MNTLLIHSLKILFPFMALYYRNRIRCPNVILTALGIAHEKHPPSFYTLDKIINSLDSFAGNVIECGVYRGSSLFGIAHLLKKRGMDDVIIYGLDSFEGFPEPTKEDALEDGTFHNRAQKGLYKETSYNELKKKVASLGFSEQVVLLQGFFEDTLQDLRSKKFILVHLDCDLYQSYKTCLTFLYDKVLPGGYIVFDEYDYSRDVYPGAQKAIDEFLKDKPESMQRFAESKSPRYFLRKS